MYGLAAEHTLQDIVQWNGVRGATFFFQAEFPYGVTQTQTVTVATWGTVSGAMPRCTQRMESAFTPSEVTEVGAISTPCNRVGLFRVPLCSLWMKHIINDQGASTQSSGKEMVSVGIGTCAVGSSVFGPGSFA